MSNAALIDELPVVVPWPSFVVRNESNVGRTFLMSLGAMDKAGRHVGLHNWSVTIMPQAFGVSDAWERYKTNFPANATNPDQVRTKYHTNEFQTIAG